MLHEKGSNQIHESNTLSKFLIKKFVLYMSKISRKFPKVKKPRTFAYMLSYFYELKMLYLVPY